MSTSQTQSAISENLFRIKNHIELNLTNAAFFIAPIIVTDFSWALINSVVLVFNKCSISQYLDYCFSLIFDKKKSAAISSLLSVRIYLCSTHFLKLIIKRAKKTKCDKEHTIFFIFCFTLLQNACTIQDFERYLTNVVILFLLPFHNNRVAQAANQLKIDIWSGIILFSWQSLYPNKFEKFSRLTNNPVENWFRILKHNILKEKQKPSVHSTKVLRKLLYEYYKNYEKIDQRSFDSIFGKETHNRKSDECEEKWSKKKVKKRTKGFYFSDDISFCNKNQNLMSSNNFDQHIRAIFDIEKEDSDTGMSQN